MEKKVGMNLENLRFFKDFFSENKNDKDFMEEMLSLFRENISLLNKKTDEAIHSSNCEECAIAFHHMTNNFSAMSLGKHGEKTRNLEQSCRKGCIKDVVKNYKSLQKDMNHILTETDYILYNYVNKENVLTH